MYLTYNLLSQNNLKLILSTLFLFLILGVNGQEYIAHVKKIGMEDGLSSYNVNCVFQDADGYIWIGTDYGLNRYDGSSIRTYTKEENGLCHNYVNSIIEDQNKMFWIVACDKGGDWTYCIFDKYKQQFISLESYLGKEPPFIPNVTQAYAHRNKIIFCEEKPEDDKNINFYEYSGVEITKLFSVNRYHPIIKGKTQEGIFDVGENRYAGFWRDIDPTKSVVVLLDQKGNFLESYFCDAKHPNMIGTRTYRRSYCLMCTAVQDGYWYLNLHNDFKQTQKQYPRVKANWGDRIGLSDDKTYILNSDSLKIYSREGVLLSGIYLGLSLKGQYFGLPMVDRDGNIWFHDQEHLYCISLEKKWFDAELQHPDNPIRLRGIALQPDGNIIAGGFSFLYKLLGTNNWTTFEIASNNYLGMHRADSILWLGTEAYKLCKLNLKSNKLEEFPNSTHNQKIPSSLIWVPFISSDGQVWAGGNRGIYRLDDAQKKLMPFKAYEALGSSTVYAFHQNKAGTWLSTSTGLYLVDLKQEKVLKLFNKSQTGNQFIPAEHIAHVHEDKEGIFWMATKGDGLVRWNPKTGAYQQYTQGKSGLSHNVLYAVYGDDYGNLWISSQRGLMRFHKETASVNVYLKEDGLPHNEFNTISHYQSADGHLYFGGQNGLVHFHPKDIENNKALHPLLITEYGKQVKGTDSIVNLTAGFFENGVITIYPGDKAAIVKFALLDYQNSQNHQYAYQIVGYDKNWNYQNENEIKISGLPYGTFDLKIKAKNANASNWMEYPKSIKIKVIKPIYLQTWFIVLMLGLLAAGIYGAVRLRFRQLEQSKLELERIVKDRTQKIEKDKSVIEQQAEELRSLDELKTKFFANISHELRTPLTLILGPLSYILDNPEELDKDAVKDQLLVMRQNGKNLLGLIEEILDLSKLEANKLELQEEPTSVSQFFEYIFSVFEPQFQLKKLAYKLVLNLEREDLTLWLDRKKLEKVMNNFLSNAIKFTDKAGTITITVTEETDLLRIVVSDTGKGVHPNDLPFIFDRFYQSKQADQTLYGGTGIGLALVSDFAKLMGGKVYAESEWGEGSRFCFEIPKKEAVGTELNILPIVNEEWEEELIDEIGYDFTIMVVEDNKDMREFIFRLLQTRYKKVLLAQNGEDGLQYLQTEGNNIQLIISDIMMPEVDGLTMLKEIKSKEKWWGIPVIMLTALAAERDKLNALTIGVDDYLTKPFSVNELLIRVQNLLYNYHQRILLKKTFMQEDLSEDFPTTGEKNERLSADTIWIKEAENKVKDSVKIRVLDVEELAKAMSISSRQLSRKLNEITGLSTSKFIREVQLMAALHELEDGASLSVKEVCFNNGFEQVSTFSKLFKKRFGKNPSEYLKSGA